MSGALEGKEQPPRLGIGDGSARLWFSNGFAVIRPAMNRFLKSGSGVDSAVDRGGIAEPAGPSGKQPPLQSVAVACAMFCAGVAKQASELVIVEVLPVTEQPVLVCEHVVV